MSLSAEQSLISKMMDLGKWVKYDIDEYNCSDFSLEVFFLISPSLLTASLLVSKTSE